MVGKPKPITLGTVRWLDPQNRTLNDSAGSARAAYDVADSYFEGISELRQRGVLQTAILSVTNRWIAIAGTALAFALVHDPQ